MLDLIGNPKDQFLAPRLIVYNSFLQSDREPLSTFLSEKLKEISLVNGVRDSPEPKVPVAVS